MEAAQEIAVEDECYGLGIRRFLRRYVLERVEHMPAWDDGMHAPSPGLFRIAVQVAERYFESPYFESLSGCHILVSEVLQGFAEAQKQLWTYRDYGYHRKLTRKKRGVLIDFALHLGLSRRI